jgi:outer membrane protein N
VLQALASLAWLVAVLPQTSGTTAPQAPPAQAATAPAPPTAPDELDLIADDGFKLVPYGSLRVVAGINSDGQTGIDNNGSRVGLNFLADITETIEAVGRAEFGLNLVDNDQELDFSPGDPNFAVGEGAETISTRLGYVGARGELGEFTWGKRWSVYYDYCAEWTDRFLAVGGDASGTYNAGTDGGISGTGRAEAAFQYRSPDLGPFSAGVQWQNRSRTDEDEDFADTWGAALDVELGAGLKLGVAFNDVRDGVDDPELNEPKEGDQSFIVGAQWTMGDWYVAANYNRSDEHETDDEGTFFDAQGAELYASLALDARHTVYAGFNWLEPDDSDYGGDFERRYVAAGVSRAFGLERSRSVVFLECALEDSTAADGSDGRDSVFGGGMRLNF